MTYRAIAELFGLGMALILLGVTIYEAIRATSKVDIDEMDTFDFL